MHTMNSEEIYWSAVQKMLDAKKQGSAALAVIQKMDNKTLSLLLDRPANQNSTFDDLYHARLQFDVPCEKFLELCKQENEIKKCSKTKRIQERGFLHDCLNRSLCVFLAMLNKKDRLLMTVGKTGNQFNKDVAFALHDVTRYHRSLRNVTANYELRKRAFEICVEIVQQKGRKVTKADAEAAMKKAKDDLIKEKSAAIKHVEAASMKHGKVPTTTKNKKATPVPMAKEIQTHNNHRSHPTTDVPEQVTVGGDIYKNGILSPQEYADAVEDFGGRLEEISELGYFDVQLGLTAKEKSGDLAGKPIIKEYTMRDKKSSREFKVWVAYNPVSPSFYQYILHELNLLEWIKGKDSRHGSYVHVGTSTNPPAGMTIGNKTYFNGVEANDFVKKLIALMKFLMRAQNIFVTKISSGKYFVPMDCNLVHILIGGSKFALYSWHSDSGHLLCDQDPKNTMYLPSIETQQTITLVITNAKDIADASHSVQWRANDSDATLGKINTNGCCMHWQGPFSQYMTSHKVSECTNKETPSKGTDIRCSISARYTASPCFTDKTQQQDYEKRVRNDLNGATMFPDRSAEYEKINVIDQLSSYELCPPALNFTEAYASDQVANEGTQERPRKRRRNMISEPVNLVKPINLRSPANTDLFHQLSQDEFDSLGIVRPGPLYTTATNIATQVSSATLIRGLMEKHVLVEIATSRDKSGNAVPCLYKIATGHGKTTFPRIGKGYKLQNIGTDAGVKHQDRSHRILSNKDGTANIIVLTHPYKNNGKQIKEVIDKVTQYNKRPQDTSLYDKDCDGSIEIFGSGGAPQITGDFAPNLDKVHKDDPYCILPESQDLNNETNRLLIQKVRQQAVVAVFVNTANFSVKGHQSINEDDAVFIGYYKFDGCLFMRDEIEPLRKEFGNESMGVQTWIRHRLVPYLRFFLSPLFTQPQWESILGNEGRSVPYRRLLAFKDDDTKLKANIDLGVGSSTAKTLQEGEMVDIYALQCKFIESGQYEKYLVSDELLADEEVALDNNDVDDTECTSLNSSQVLKTTANIQDLVTAAAYNNAAGAKRYLGQSVINMGGREVACPLVNLALGKNLRLYPNPMTNRTLDPNSLWLFCHAVRIGLFHNHELNKRVVYDPEKMSPMMDTLFFGAILLRCTGRLKPYELYFLRKITVTLPAKKRAARKHHSGHSRDMEDPTTMPIHRHMLPTMNDLDNFLSFMSSTVAGNKTDSIGQWISDQHKGEIPKCLHNFDVFSAYIRKVKDILPEFLRTVLGERNKPRADVVHELSILLSMCVSSAAVASSFTFLSQQILADIEELFSDPFGPVITKTLVAGFGAKEGLKTILNEKDKATMANIFDEYVAMVKKLPDEMLGILGLKQISKGMVINKRNSRPISATDGEHALCKLYLLICHTMGGRCFSKKPNASKPHCWPLRLCQHYWEQDDNAFITKIFQEIDNAFELCKANNELKSLPGCCWLIGENYKNDADQCNNTADEAASALPNGNEQEQEQDEPNTPIEIVEV